MVIDKQRMIDYVKGWEDGFKESFRHSRHDYQCHKQNDKSVLLTNNKNLEKLIKSKFVKRYAGYCDSDMLIYLKQ